MRKAIFTSVLVLTILSTFFYLKGNQSASPVQDAHFEVTVKGATGQTLSADRITNLADGQKVVITGRGYDKNIGIYVTYCVVPPIGERPEECGPFDITGKKNTSVWISSNPPVYGKLIAKPFSEGGSFQVAIPAKRFIGTTDCRKVACAFTTRADHTQPDNRSADLFIPATFK